MENFVGNCPSNVSKDAKYKIRLENREHVVGLFYRSADGELWYPSSNAHPELVNMVNELKIAKAGAPGGAFYINEYGQVIVPVVGEDKDYYLAGEYTTPLEFEFEGKILSGDAKDLEGKPLKPGDRWVGPHPGIPYVLKAGGTDIYYRCWVRPRVEREVRLSDSLGTEAAKGVAATIADIRGRDGGRFYINEFRQMFTPKEGEAGLDYVYIGKVNDLSLWFPKPHA